MRCRFCQNSAVAAFLLDLGCACCPEDRGQSLCLKHVMQARPRGRMELLHDLTEDASFGGWWQQWCGQKKG